MCIRDSFEIVIVENGSTDGTQALADQIGRDNPEVNVVTLPKADYGAAVARGFEVAQVYEAVSYTHLPRRPAPAR